MRANTRDRLIYTAIELVWKNSYGSVSVDDICRAADVKKGSFYHYFPSKADLAVAAMEAHYEESKTEFYNEVFSASLSPVERFERLADGIYQKQKDILEKYGRVCGCPFASLGSEMSGQEEKIREKIYQIFSRYDRYYHTALRDMIDEGILPADIDIRAKTAEIYNYLMGQVMMARILNSLEPLEADLKTGLMRLIGVRDDIDVR